MGWAPKLLNLTLYFNLNTYQILNQVRIAACQLYNSFEKTYIKFYISLSIQL